MARGGPFRSDRRAARADDRRADRSRDAAAGTGRGGRAPHRGCDARRRRSSAADRRARRPLARRRGTTDRHRADVGAEHRHDHHRQRRRARPDAGTGARRCRFRRGGHWTRADRGGRAAAGRRRGRRPSRCRTCSPDCAPGRVTGGAPIRSRRWSARSRCPTTARSTSTSPCASTSGRPTTCSPSCSASTGRWRRRRLTGVASAAGWAVADGDPATSWITPFGGAVGSTVTFTADEPFDSFELVQPTGDFSPDHGHPGVGSRRRRSRRRTASGRSTVTLPVDRGRRRRDVGDHRRSSRAVTLDRRYAEPVVLPAAISEISAGRQAERAGCRSTPGVATTCSPSTANRAGARSAAPSRRRSPATPSSVPCATGTRSTSTPGPTGSRRARVHSAGSTSIGSCSPRRTVRRHAQPGRRQPSPHRAGSTAR